MNRISSYIELVVVLVIFISFCLSQGPTHSSNLLTILVTVTVQLKTESQIKQTKSNEISLRIYYFKFTNFHSRIMVIQNVYLVQFLVCGQMFIIYSVFNFYSETAVL